MLPEVAAVALSSALAESRRRPRVSTIAMSSSSSAGDKYGPDIHDGDRAAWANMNDKARTWLLQMTVFIISIKKNLGEIELWNSYFIRVLKYWGLKIRVLANPCVPSQKTV